MSVSGKQAVAEINLDEFERRLRSAGSQQTSAEDLLAELAWLVDSSALLPTCSPRPSQAVSMPGQTDIEPQQPLEIATLQPANDVEPDEQTRTASVDIEAPRASKFGDAYRRDPIGVDSSTERRSGGWTLKVWALALAAGAALIAAVFTSKGGAPGQPNAPPFVASADGSTKAPQRSDETVATSSDAGTTPRKDITQPAAVKGVTSEEPPIEHGDRASLGNAPPAANLTPTAGAAQSTVGASPGSPVSVVVNTPVVAPPFAAPPPAAHQLPDPLALRRVSPRPDRTQIATTTPSDSGETVRASDGPQPPAKPATNGASEAAGVAQPPTKKLDLPKKLSTRPSARIVVAKTETAAPGPEADKVPATPMEPQAASAVPVLPAPKPVDPLSHALSYIVGALGVPAASAPRPAVRGVTSEETPIERGDRASLGNAPPAANLTPTSAGAAQSTVGASSGPPVSVVVNTPGVAPPFAAPPPAAPQFHDPKAKPSAPIVVAKTETVAAGPGAEKAPETPRAQQPVNPLSHAFSDVVGALGVPAASAPKPVDQTAAHKSGDWAIQFAAKKSEAEAKVNVARFNAKYAAALNGATIGVNKTLVNGETIYALRVTGLSKAEAAALCERLKGRDCFIAK
jgi:SPOR domain